MLVTPSRGIARTRNGCWTCRSRRKRCDEGKPRCQACQNLGLVCQGYGIRLKWSGRGRPHVRFNQHNRQSPKRPDTPQHVSGALLPNYVGYSGHDLILLQHLGEKTFKTLSGFEREVLYDYAVWGSLTLFARPVPDPDEHVQEILTGCAQSKPMLTNCITYQMTIDSKHSHRVEEYYAKSIALFRATLMKPDWLEDEMAPYAGVLLSTICMHRGTPWTLHISGIASILLEQGYFDQNSEDSQCLAALIGVLDLPTHTLGRQTKHMHLWHKYCRDMDGIEELCGLPCSLVHLLAAAAEPDIEDRIEKWTIEEVDPTMKSLWEVSHQAAIVMVREWRRDHNLSVREDMQTDLLAVTRMLALLQETHPLMIQYRMLHWDPWLFPMVAAASQKSHLTSEGRAFVRECVLTIARKPLGEVPYYAALVSTLDTFWSCNDTRSLQQVTRDLRLELALF